jgi:ADP-heptose:LPS heptosyltransferase
VKKEVNIALIQLTRIGDILQAYQVIKQAKLEHPNLNFTLIGRKKFTGGLRFLLDSVCENIIEIDTKSFFEKEASFKSALSELHDLIDEINQTEFDLVVNLTFNKSSSYLTSLINGKMKMGLHRNNLGQVAINDKWSQYIYATVMSGNQNPFNLVEIYRNIIGVKNHTIEEKTDNKENLIVIHPFASQVKKRWGSSKWTEVIYKVLKDNPDFQLDVVGGKEDIYEAEKLKGAPALSNFQNRINFKVGNHSIEDTYNRLKIAKVFVGHDSMVSHLAMIAGTPTVTISLGIVRPAETTPYGLNAYNIVPKTKCFPCNIETSCNLMPCHKDINYQTVASTVNSIILEGDVTKDNLYNNISTFHLSSSKIVRSDINKNGNFKLNTITDDFVSFDDCTHTFYSLIWNAYLKNEEINTDIPRVNEDTANKLANNLQGIQYLFEIYNFAAKFAKELVDQADSTTPDTNKINELVSKLGEIDRLCDVTKTTYPLTKPIIEFFHVSKSNAAGKNLKEVSENYLLSYFDASNLCAMLFELTEQTIRPFIPPQDTHKKNKEV